MTEKVEEPAISASSGNGSEEEEEEQQQEDDDGTTPITAKTKKKRKIKGLLKGSASALAKATTKGAKVMAGSAGAVVGSTTAAAGTVYQASKDGVQQAAASMIAVGSGNQNNSKSKNSSSDTDENVVSSLPSDATQLGAESSTATTTQSTTAVSPSKEPPVGVKGTTQAALQSASRSAQKVYQAGVDGAGAVVKKGADVAVAKPLRKGAEVVAVVKKGADAAVGKPLRKGAQVASQSVEKVSSGLFVSKQQGTDSEKDNKEEEEEEKEDLTDTSTGEPALPPDEALQEMDILLSKRLVNVSVEDYYQATWQSMAFCQERLDNQGSFEVQIGDWEELKNDTTNNNNHDNDDDEKFDQTRVVQFQFNVSTPIPGFPSVAGVHETQFGRIQENKDRCVIRVNIQTSSVPFCDSFYVHQRWVATRIGRNDLSIQAGIFVVFKKSCFVAGKIRSTTKQESPKKLLAHYELMKTACGAQEAGEQQQQEETAAVLAVEPTTEEEVAAASPLDIFAKQPFALFATCFPFLVTSTDEEDLDDVDQQLREIGDKLQIIKALPAVEDPLGREEQVKHVETKFGTVDQAMDAILLHVLAPDHPFISIDTTTQSSETDEKETETAAAAVPEQRSLDSSAATTPLIQLSRKGKALPKSIRRLLLRPSKLQSVRRTAETKTNKESAGDDPLSSMNVVLNKQVEDIRVSEFYDLFLAGSLENSDDQSFYKTWLENSGKSNVVVGKWEVASGGGADDNSCFVDSWDGEQYQQKREVQFQYELQNFLGHGSRMVQASGQQFFRFNKDKSQFIMTTTYSLRHVAFSRSFRVHVRHVGVNSREGGKQMELSVGVFVVLLRKSLIAGKIRAGVIQETTRNSTDFYRACEVHLHGELSSKKVSLSDSIQIDVFDEVESSANPLSLLQSPFRVCVPNPQLGTMITDDEQLSRQMQLIERKFAAIKAVLEKDREEIEGISSCLGQLEVIVETLSDMIEWNANR